VSSWKSVAEKEDFGYNGRVMKEMHLLILIAVWLLNFGISWWNAYICGKTWIEVKSMGRMPRFMNWMGAIMSACGFTWCYLQGLLFGAYHIQPYFLKPDQAPILTEHILQSGLSLGYLIIIPGVMFSGTMLWLDSVVKAWRQRDLPSIGTAAWNTYAQFHNTYSTYSGISGAFNSVQNLFKKDDEDDVNGAGVLIVVLLVAFAVLGGVLSTWGIISHFAATEPLPKRSPAYA
jgi:hypothetical protein